MFRLTREVRFAINAGGDDQLDRAPSNSYGGFPSIVGLGVYYTARVTLRGELGEQSQYLVNIKDVDDAVRQYLREAKLSLADPAAHPPRIVREIYAAVAARWPNEVARVALALSPLLALSLDRSEFPMMSLSQKFEFAASHRLHNPSLGEAANRKLFGKCNNPNGHGHNYELQVTVRGNESLADLPALERIVASSVIDRVDHKNLNIEVPEFRELNPTVENIAKVIHGWLKPQVENLASVTVWETAKTWCEYGE
ncbi:MAG TPA: 6-carboxytetrahydropterin synthase [Tepidisphaeraceae bacterium]|nr:6-carboxytetrahydropterin synthase [Tepidisphaeraceae bacterium]